jgi:hypothetical protein
MSGFHRGVNEIYGILVYTQRRMVVFTDVSTLPIGHIFKGLLGLLVVEDEADSTVITIDYYYYYYYYYY